MNGRCKPNEQASGQKNRNLAQLLVKDVLFGHLGRGYRPPLPLPGYTNGLNICQTFLIVALLTDPENMFDKTIPATVEQEQEQESCAIAKMAAQCALHMGALKIFGTA